MEPKVHHLTEASVGKLTAWENEPDVRTLKMDLEATKQAHDVQIGKIGNWNDILAVRGRHKPKKIKGRSSVQPKLARRQAEWRYSALTEPFLANNQLFEVSPTTFEDGKGAKQNTLVLNHQFTNQINTVKFIDDYVRSDVDDGTAIVRVGWERVMVKVIENVPVWTYTVPSSQEQLDALQQAVELKQQDPRHYNENVDPAIKAAVDFYEETQQATVAIQTGTQPVETEKPMYNRPTVSVRNPANVYIDPTCEGDLDKATFVIESFETSKAELLKAKGKYKNLDKVDWEGNNPLSLPDHEASSPETFRLADQLRKKIVAFEYWGFWDIHGTGELVPIVATWVGGVMIRLEENPFPDGKVPYVVVAYMPIKREIYGEPDAELIEDNQAVLGAITRGMIDLLGRSANSQLGFAKGWLDPLNRRKYENGQDYEFNASAHPTNGVHEHKYPELPQSALLMLNLQNQEAEALTGVKSFAGGISGEAYGDVAAGIRGVLDAASKREMAILRRLAYGLKQVALKIIAMNAVFLSEEEVVRITNEKFETVRREDLKGNYDVKVDISTAEIEEAKAKDLAFLLQTIGNTLDQGIVLHILSEIARLKRMPELAEMILQFKPTPSEHELKMQELAIREMEAKIELLMSQIRLNDAKAAEAGSKKDKLDLDFVEQETGTTQAREIEKQQAQARGNQNLQVTKALTTPQKEGETTPDIETAVGFNEVSERLGQFQQQPTVDNFN